MVTGVALFYFFFPSFCWPLILTFPFVFCLRNNSPGLDAFLDMFLREQLLEYTLPESYVLPLIPGEARDFQRPVGVIKVIPYMYMKIRR
jgi:hypothetical protein